MKTSSDSPRAAVTLGAPLSDWDLARRMLAMSWSYRGQCIQILACQVGLLLLGLSGLSLTGVGIDYIRGQIQPSAKPPHWPFGLAPPADWSPMEVLFFAGGLILALASVRAVLSFFYSVKAARLIEMQVVVDLRARVYDKLQRLSFRFFDANASGSIINRVTGDARGVVNFVNGVLLQGVVLILSLVIYLAYMLSLHAGLTWACLGIMPVVAALTIGFSRWVRPAHRRNRELMDRMVASFSEGIQGMQTVKGFAREREQIAKFHAATELVCGQQNQIFRWMSLYVPAVHLLNHAAMVILLIYGGHLVIRGELPLGSGLIVFVSLLQQFFGQVTGLASIANTVQHSLTSARRTFEILDAPVEIQSPADAVRLPKARGAIRFERVSFEYAPGTPCLRELDFEVRPGQCLAILGATGSGKSTLLSLIPRFYDPTLGRLLVDGHDVRALDLQDLRRNVGVVFQESFLFSNTVAANIAFGCPRASRDQVERAAKIAAAHDFITALPQGYQTVLGESGVNLSGGQRQRLAIARAVLLDPSILLLDDPTAAIDVQTEREILEALDRAIAGRTTIIVAHRLSTLQRADLILVMDDGRVVQQGTHDQLMAVKGRYLSVAKLQLVDAESLQILNAP